MMEIFILLLTHIAKFIAIVFNTNSACIENIYVCINSKCGISGMQFIFVTCNQLILLLSMTSSLHCFNSVIAGMCVHEDCPVWAYPVYIVYCTCRCVCVFVCVFFCQSFCLFVLIVYLLDTPLHTLVVTWINVLL